MSELSDASSDEPLDNTTASNAFDPFESVCTSVHQTSLLNMKYNSSNIKIFLKEQPEKYTLVDNNKVNHVKPFACWSRFALPPVKDENNQSILIKGFASCRSYFTTYTYTCGSTKPLNSHKYLKESLSTSRRIP